MEIKLNTIVLWMILLVNASCMTIKYMPLADYSHKFQRCRIRCYNPNILKSVADKKCGDKFKSGNYPPKRCEGLIGVFDKDFAKELRPKVLKNIQYCEDIEDGLDYYEYD